MLTIFVVYNIDTVHTCAYEIVLAVVQAGSDHCFPTTDASAPASTLFPNALYSDSDSQVLDNCQIMLHNIEHSLLIYS